MSVLGWLRGRTRWVLALISTVLAVTVLLIVHGRAFGAPPSSSPGPQMFSNTIPMPKTAAALPAGFAPQTPGSTASVTATQWLASEGVGSNMTLPVAKVTLVTGSAAEIQQGIAFADYPSYVWEIQYSGPVQLGGRTYPYVAVFVDASTGVVEGLHSETSLYNPPQ